MKANEIFPGAIVRVNRDGLCIKKDTIVEVRAVDADDKLIEKGLIGSAHCRPLDDDQFEGGIWCEYLSPIPLTPEILEKNGFYYDEDKKAYLMGVIFRVKPERYGLFSFEICGCPYPLNTVSQLQHALRLCQIDKEIEL